MSGVMFIFVAIVWFVMFLTLFTRARVDKFTVGAAYIIVILVFIERAIDYFKWPCHTLVIRSTYI